MPKRGQHDPTTGDPRRRFAAVGGPAGRHAQTHDVTRELATNPVGIDAERRRRDAIAEQELEADLPAERVPAADEKEIVKALDQLSGEELRRLPVLKVGSPLRQGAAYLDLADGERREFRAMGGDSAQPGQRIVAKGDVDHELWNRLIGS